MRYPKALYIALSLGIGGYVTHRQAKKSIGASPFPYMKDKLYGYVGSLCGSAASELNSHFGPSIVDKRQKLGMGTAEPIGEEHETDVEDHVSSLEKKEPAKVSKDDLCMNELLNHLMHEEVTDKNMSAFYKKLGIDIDEDEHHVSEYDDHFLKKILQSHDPCAEQPCEEEAKETPCPEIIESEPCPEIVESEPCPQVAEPEPCQEVGRIVPCSNVSEPEPCIEANKTVHEDHSRHDDTKAHIGHSSHEASHEDRYVKGTIEIPRTPTSVDASTQVGGDDDEFEDDDDDEVDDEEYSADNDCDKAKCIPVVAGCDTGVRDPAKAISSPDPCIPTRTKVLYDGYVSYLDTRTPTTCLTYQTIDCTNLRKSEHSHCECIRFCCCPPPGLVFGNKDNKKRAQVIELLLPTTHNSGGEQICVSCIRSGVWKVFNNYIAFLLQKYKKVEVCSGALHLGDQSSATGRVPTHLFKALICENPDHTFRFECYKIEDIPMHRDLPALKCFLISRKDLEAQSGFHIFDKVPEDKIRERETHSCFK